MRTNVVTALFDINRASNGDGRTIEEYLAWFKMTLMLKSDMVIFTEEKFHKFITDVRKDIINNTTIIIQKREEIPYYKYNNTIKNIINSDEYKNKIKDNKRIECYLSEYNVIQYSKFEWLKMAINISKDYDYFYWMDAGCSRFFGSFDLNKSWPNNDKIINNKFTIQGNLNYYNNFKNMIPDTYIWDNNCMLVGTLFGGNVESINTISEKVNELFEKFIKINIVNNEQIILAILEKNNPQLFNTVVHIDGTHLPLFKLLS